MKRRFKILLEVMLQRMPAGWADRVSGMATAFRVYLNKYYPEKLWLRPLISACNFVIVRTNGDNFIEFELSNICNARCVFCPYPDMLKTDKKFMHMHSDTLQKVKQVMQRKKRLLVSFTPTTGDTLLHPEWDLYMRGIMELPSVNRATMFTNAIEMDEAACQRLLSLLAWDTKGKLSQLYFSVGGYDAQTYKALYQVDRFDKVMKNIRYLTTQLKQRGCSIGIHLHFKLKAGDTENISIAESLFNPSGYSFVYYSHSKQYYSNDGYTRNALLQYYPAENMVTTKACAYLKKTRFAADGGVWADGCVISEMPGDSSLKLGIIDDDFMEIEKRRQIIISNWEQKGIKPKPCQGCTVYRA